MHRALYFGVVGLGAALVAAQGCGGGSAATTGTGGGGASSSSTTATQASSTGAVTSTGAGGMGGAGGFEGALAIDVGTVTDGDLSPTGKVDFYTFDGTAGQALFIYTQAQAKVQSG